MAFPRLTFFCELDDDALESLLTQQVLSDLGAIQAGVSLGLTSFSSRRAQAVKRLTEAGIPVTAWLLLPREQGYWLNLQNADLLAERYPTFQAWTQEHGLRWHAVGLDIEPDIADVEALASNGWKLLPKVFARLFNRRRLRGGQEGVRLLVDRLRADGYQVEAYQHPFILDERRARSTLMRRVSGLVDASVDREVLMLYSSTYRPNGVGLLWSYAPEAQAIGIGSTGGGVETGFGNPLPLTWQEFSRDLRLAWYWTDQLYVFSLEGCVRQGFLPRLRNFTWDELVVFPEESAQVVDNLRGGLRTFLWLSTNLGWILAGAGLGLVIVNGLRRRSFR